MICHLTLILYGALMAQVGKSFPILTVNTPVWYCFLLGKGPLKCLERLWDENILQSVVNGHSAARHQTFVVA